MAKKTPKHRSTKIVETLKHDDARRTYIPTVEYQSVMVKDEQDPIRVAYERRNRDLDPQLVWRGKDEQNWSDLVLKYKCTSAKMLIRSYLCLSMFFNVTPILFVFFWRWKNEILGWSY